MIIICSNFVLAILFLLAINCLVEGGASPSSPFWNPQQNRYPNAKRISKTYSYRSAKAKGNVTISDPYNWLEKDLTTDPDVIKFINDQTNLTESFMAKCKDQKAIEQSINDAQDYDDYNNFNLVSNALVPFYTYTLQRANENRQAWYVCSPEELQAAIKTKFATPPGKKFLMEEYLSENGTAGIAGWLISPNGKYFAYLVSDTGSQVSTWFVRTFDSPLLGGGKQVLGGLGHLPNDVVPNSDGGFIWTMDSKGFFYTSALPTDAGYNTEVGSTVRYHKIGTKYEQDITIVHADKTSASGADNYWGVYLCSDGRWLMVPAVQDALLKARLYATYLPGQELSDKMKWIGVAPGYDYVMTPVNVIDDVLYVQTNLNASDGKIVKTKLDWTKARQVSNLSELTERLPLTDVIPNVKNEQLASSYPFMEDKVVLLYVINGIFVTKIYNLKSGKLIKTVLPKESPGSINTIIPYFKGKSFNVMTSTLQSPRKIFNIVLDGSEYSEILILEENVKGVKPGDFTSETLFATSKDGTQVPYLCVYRKGTPKNGSKPAQLHAFGSYGLTQVNYYDASTFAWLQGFGGFYCYAEGRGGGDRGAEWHAAGQKHNKEKTFEDIVAVAQDLVKRKIAAPGKVIADGRSAGGLAIAAAANQDPSAFDVLLLQRAVLDYFLRKRSRGGSAQMDEFGNVDDPVDFDYIRAWSPLQNIPMKGNYPATFLTPGAGDDQVVPAHSFKFLAELQRDHPNNPLPLLMYLVDAAGHQGQGADSAMPEAARQQCFSQLALGLERVKRL